MTLAPYHKTVTAIVTGVIGWAGVVIISEPTPISAAEWLGLAVVVATALGVYAVPNISAVTQRRDAAGRFTKDGGQTSLLTVLMIVALVLIILYFLGVNVAVD